VRDTRRGEGPEERPAEVNPDVRFEHVDADPATIARWAVGLGTVTAVVAAALVWFLVFLRHREAVHDPQRPALYFATEERQPEGVRLQTSPFQDLRALREEERQVLHGYGWVDQAGGVVHIPIEDAMALFLRRQAASASMGGGASSSLSAAGVPTDSAPVPSPLPAASPSPAAPPIGGRR